MRSKWSRLLALGLIIFCVYYVNTWVQKAAQSTNYSDIAELPLDQANSTNNQSKNTATSSIDQPQLQKSQEEILEQDNKDVEKQYKDLEKSLRKGFLNREDEFTVTYRGDSEKLSKALQGLVDKALSADDYTAYILSSYRINTKSWGEKNTITVEASYRESFEQTEQVNRTSRQVLSKIIKDGMNDHEKVLAIHDWIVENVEYDQSLTYYTAYDAITRGITVCQGYSLITHRLLSDAGIETMITEGEVDTGLHSWNMVKLDGKWYHLDVTWDDPTNIEGGTYDYYLVTDKQLRKDHSWTKQYPTANTDYNAELAKLAGGKASTGKEVLVSDQDSEQSASKFVAIRKKIGLHWFDEENTVRTIEEMSKLFQRIVKDDSKQVTFRYASSASIKDALKKSMQTINKTISYRATFSEMKDGVSQLVTVYLDY